MRSPATPLRHVSSIQYHIAEELLLIIASILKFADGKETGSYSTVESKRNGWPPIEPLLI